MGKGGSALNVWIKEFSALVFTQTIQAFLYAIVISIILFGMQTDAQISAGDNNAAIGLMATFALISIFKVESLVRRIFGLNETKAAPGSAIKSLAKTAIAAKIGKRVLDNGKKITGGIRSITKSHQDNAKLKKRLAEDMADEGFTLNDQGKLVSTGPGRSGGAGAGAGAGVAGGSVAGGSGGSGAELSNARYRRMKNSLRNYQDKAAENKRAASEGWKSIASGTLETLAAPVGGSLGFFYGGAFTGDLSSAINGGMAGAGAADKLANSAVDSIDSARQFIDRNFVNRKPGMSSKKLKESIEAYEKAIKNANVNFNSSDIDDI